MNDSRWPWLILVPRRDGLVELTDLDAADRARLIEEAARAADWLKAHAGADKINVGALGNVVRQLHVHVVARCAGDPAWPGPVWGFGAAVPYGETEARALVAGGEAGAPSVGPAFVIARSEATKQSTPAAAPCGLDCFAFGSQ